MSNVIQFPRSTSNNFLFVNHKTGKITTPTEDFGDRIQRIQRSLAKINTLMAELKKEDR